MSELIIQENQLPSTIEDLSKFILVGREKLNAVRAEMHAIDKVGLAADVRKQKLTEGQDIADAVLDAEAHIGELMQMVPKATKGNQYTGKMVPDSAVGNQKTKTEIIEEAGLTPKQVERFQILADNPEFVEEAKKEARDNDTIVTRESVLRKVKDKKKKAEVLKAEQSIAEQAGNEFKPVLYVGDCTEYKPTEKYDLLLTDPPYSTDVDNIQEFVDNWLYNALDNVKDTGFAYVFIGAYPEEQKAYLNARIPEHMELCQELIWTYKNTLGNNPKDRYKLNYQVCLFYRGINAPDLDCPLTNEQWAVQEINAPDGRQGDRYHEWQKPIEIAERFVRHSTKQGMVIYDPFACTGTFLLAAAKLGRKAYGHEINPENAKIAFTRGCTRG